MKKYRLLSLAEKAELSKGKLQAYRQWLFSTTTTYTGKRIPTRAYKKYPSIQFNSKRWRIVKRMAIEFYDGRCCSCGSKHNLQVHHRNYKNLYHETMQDLMVLCDCCHAVAHKKGPQLEAL